MWQSRQPSVVGWLTQWLGIDSRNRLGYHAPMRSNNVVSRLARAAAIMGAVGGRAGTGAAKARTSAQARAAGKAGAAVRWPVGYVRRWPQKKRQREDVASGAVAL